MCYLPTDLLVMGRGLVDGLSLNSVPRLRGVLRGVNCRALNMRPLQFIHTSSARIYDGDEPVLLLLHLAELDSFPHRDCGLS